MKSCAAERKRSRSGEECCEQRLVPAVTIHLVISAGAVSGCGFALTAIGMACKCRPIRAAKRRNCFLEQAIINKL